MISNKFIFSVEIDFFRWLIKIMFWCQENQSTHGNDGKENEIDEVNTLNSQVQSSISNLNPEKPLKRKHAQLKQASKMNTNNAATNEISEDKEFQITEQSISLDPNNALIKKRPKNNVQKKSIKATTPLELKSISKESIKINGVTSNIPADGENVQIKNIGSNDEPHNDTLKIHAKNIVHKEIEVDLVLLVGNDSITIGGTELPSRDVGQVLQFLEFCAAFGKVMQLQTPI